MRKASYILVVLMAISLQSISQEASQVFRAAGTPSHPKVQVSWNRYHDHAGLVSIMKKINQAYPDLTRMVSVGKSYKGNDIWCIAVTDYKKGDASRKPGMYIDGNIHSNEVQGSEFALYTAWYLTETFNDVPFIRELLADKIFYIVPTINPDARDDFFKLPNTASSPRSGVVPVDNDLDGLVDEDGYDDLDGDGNIVMMRRKNPNGRFREDISLPGRMIQVTGDERGEYELLGSEGLDNDGDGAVNEDGAHFEYDPNRDWGWNWQPSYIQNGAYKYPFSLPENRSVMQFVMNHPNIAGAQSYHNSGGMILRGPGAAEDVDLYNASDLQIYDAIGKKGEQMIPGYKYLVVYKDLYSVFGGELDWFYGGRGIFTFSNELFTPFLMFNDSGRSGNTEQYRFNEMLLFKDAFVTWKPFNHPQYGPIEIGGFKKNFNRMHPGFLLESDAHRNMAFTIYHAYHTPKLVIDTIMEKSLGDGLMEITAVVSNKRMIPTHSSQDLKHKIERPDHIILNGRKVLAAMVVDNRNSASATEQKKVSNIIEVDNIPGNGFVTVRWITQGTGKYNVVVDSMKGGVTER